MKRLVANILVVMLFFSIAINLMGCSLKASYYTEEEHIQRITERIEKKREKWNRIMYPEGETYSNFKVYPLYDENDEFKYCLAEFEPYGFFVVGFYDLHFISWCFSNSMYKYSTIYGWHRFWSPYKYEKINIYKPYPTNEDRVWILDENGERIYYDRSPYFVTGNINEKKYLIHIGGGRYACTIKNDDQFINLVSGEVIDFNNLIDEEVIGLSSTPVSKL